MKHTPTRPAFYMHTLELTDDELFQLWNLSRAGESGDRFPHGTSDGVGVRATPRVWEWVDADTDHRFRKDKTGGRVVVGSKP